MQALPARRRRRVERVPCFEGEEAVQGEDGDRGGQAEEEVDTGGKEEGVGAGERESRVHQVKQGEESTSLLRVGPPARRFADWSGSGRGWSPGTETIERFNAPLQPLVCSYLFLLWGIPEL